MKIFDFNKPQTPSVVGISNISLDETTNTLVFTTESGVFRVNVSTLADKDKITSFAVDANTNAIVLKTDKGDFSIGGDEIKTILGSIATNSGDTIQSISFDEQTKTLTLATDKGEFSAVINIQTQVSGGLSISAVSIDANTNVLTIEEGGNKHTVDLTPIIKNIYNSDGTLKANRKVVLNGKTITFEGANYPTVKVLSTDINGGVIVVGDADGEMQIYSRKGSLFIWSTKLNKDILRYDANVKRWTFFDPIRPKTIIDKAGSTGDADFILTSDGQGGLEWKDDIRAKLIETKHHMELSQRTDGDITYANSLLSITQPIRYTLFAGNVWTVDAIADMNVPDGSVVYFATNEQEMLSGNTKQVSQAQLLVEPLDTWIAAHDKVPVGFSRKGVFYLLNGDSSFKPQATGSTLYSSDGAINEDRTVTVNANLKFANNQVSFDKLNPSVILDKNVSDGRGFNVLKSDEQGGIVWTPLEPISVFEGAIEITSFPVALENQYYFKQDTGDVYIGRADGSLSLVDRARIAEGAILRSSASEYVFSSLNGWTKVLTDNAQQFAEFAEDLLLEVENDKAVTTHTLLNGLTWEQAKTQYDTFRFVLKAGNGVYQDSVYSAELDAKDIVNNIRLFHISHDNATMFIRYTIKDTATGEIVNESANTAPHAIRIWGIKKPNGFARVSALRSERIATNVTVGAQDILTPLLKDWKTIDVTLSPLSGLSANVFVTREEITNSQVRVVPVFDGTNLVAATLQISPNADGTIRISLYQAPTGTSIKSITLQG